MSESFRGEWKLQKGQPITGFVREIEYNNGLNVAEKFDPESGALWTKSKFPDGSRKSVYDYSRGDTPLKLSRLQVTQLLIVDSMRTGLVYIESFDHKPKINVRLDQVIHSPDESNIELGNGGKVNLVYNSSNGGELQEAVVRAERALSSYGLEDDELYNLEPRALLQAMIRIEKDFIEANPVFDEALKGWKSAEEDDLENLLKSLPDNEEEIRNLKENLINLAEDAFMKFLSINSPELEDRQFLIDFALKSGMAVPIVTTLFKNRGDLSSVRVESVIREVIIDHISFVRDLFVKNLSHNLKIAEINDNGFTFQEIETEAAYHSSDKHETIVQKGDGVFGEHIKTRGADFIVTKNGEQVFIRCIDAKGTNLWEAVFPLQIDVNRLCQDMRNPDIDFRILNKGFGIK